jgi:multidrug/hemolysin transport system permease protein
MTVVLSLIQRNLRLFFRDRMNVFFSLLSGLVLFLLYTLFLSRLQTDGLKTSFPDATAQQVNGFVDSWMFSGIVLLTTITTGLGALSVLVEDRQSGRFADYLVSPVRRSQLVLGYLVSAIIVAIIMSTFVLALSLLYLGLVDAVWLSPLRLFQVAAVMVLCCGAFTALSALVTSFLRSTSAFSAMSTVVGTILGFIAGAYIPIGSLPGGVASAVNTLPFAQAAMLLRRPFTADTLAALTEAVPDAAGELRTFYGIDIFVGDAAVPVWLAVAVLGAMVGAFTALSAGRIRTLIR